MQTSAQLVSADGTAAQVTKAFNTSLESFQLGGAAVYVNTQPALVPSSLGNVVSAVLGLSNAAKMSVHPNLHARARDVLPRLSADRSMHAGVRRKGRADVL